MSPTIAFGIGYAGIDSRHGQVTDQAFACEVEELMSRIGQCALCGQTKELRQSHVIPSFAIRWLKRTAATGFLRQGANPNVRVQDSARDSLLCESCEQLFSVYEKQFAENIFIPFQDQNAKVFHYDEWLRKFVVSLSWRIAYLEVEFPDNAPALVLKRRDTAIRFWREYLLGMRRDPGIGNHFVMFLGTLDSLPDGRDPFGTNWYFHRSCDGTITFNSDSELLVYAKLPRIVIASFIPPCSSAEWGRGSKVFKRGTLTTNQTCNVRPLTEYMLLRAELVQSVMDNVSGSERDKVHRAIVRNPMRAEESLAAGFWTGEKMVIRVPDQ